MSAGRRLEKARDLEPGRPENDYLAARFAALDLPAGGTDETDAARRKAIDGALDLLGGAVAKGFADPARMRDDPALEPLRDNPRFAKLVEDATPAYEWLARSEALKKTDANKIAFCDKALARDPNGWWAYTVRGMALAWKGEPDRAEADLGQALQRTTDRALVLFDLARIRAVRAAGRPKTEAGDRARRQDVEQALDALEQAVAAGWSYWERINTESDLQALRGEARYQRTLEALVPAEEWVRRARAVEMTDPAVAVAFCDKALAKSPGLAEAYSIRGGALARKGEFGPALADLQKAIELKPDADWAYYNLACFRGMQAAGRPRTPEGEASRRQDVEQALDALEQAVRKGYSNWARLEADADLQALRSEARFQRTLGALVPAEEWVRRAKAVKEKDPAAAVALYGKALEKNPGYAEAYSLRGGALLLKGEFGPAMADLQKSVELKPDAPGMYYNLACGHSLQAAARPHTVEGDASRRQDVESALDALEKAVGKGYANWAHLKADADLLPLREQPRYKKLIEGH
jgi:tetratricopeptide (TPR) repeat protein